MKRRKSRKARIRKPKRLKRERKIKIRNESFVTTGSCRALNISRIATNTTARGMGTIKYQKELLGKVVKRSKGL